MRLYLGVIDAFSFNNQTGYYNDNKGAFNLTVSLSAAVPQRQAASAGYFLVAGIRLPVWSGLGILHRQLLVLVPQQSTQWRWREVSRTSVPSLSTL